MASVPGPGSWSQVAHCWERQRSQHEDEAYAALYLHGIQEEEFSL